MAAGRPQLGRPAPASCSCRRGHCTSPTRFLERRRRRSLLAPAGAARAYAQLARSCHRRQPRTSRSRSRSCRPPCATFSPPRYAGRLLQWRLESQPALNFSCAVQTTTRWFYGREARIDQAVSEVFGGDEAEAVRVTDAAWQWCTEVGLGRERTTRLLLHFVHCGRYSAYRQFEATGSCTTAICRHTTPSSSSWGRCSGSSQSGWGSWMPTSSAGGASLPALTSC